MKKRKTISLLSAAIVLLALIAGSYLGFDIPALLGIGETPAGYSEANNPNSSDPLPSYTSKLDENKAYTTKEDVCGYLQEYGHLPDNFITKAEAKALGWDSSQGNLWDVADGCSIGGDTFGNREGLLPKTSGVKYYECDINYSGGYRVGERIVYGSDGSIYYTNDHYESFEYLGSFK